MANAGLINAGMSFPGYPSNPFSATQSTNLYKNGLSSVAHQAKTIDTPYSSQYNSDVRVNNLGFPIVQSPFSGYNLFGFPVQGYVPPFGYAGASPLIHAHPYAGYFGGGPFINSLPYAAYSPAHGIPDMSFPASPYGLAYG